MQEHLAYAYLSAATDFDISQVVDIVCGVHARIRESDFDGRRPVTEIRRADERGESRRIVPSGRSPVLDAARAEATDA